MKKIGLLMIFMIITNYGVIAQTPGLIYYPPGGMGVFPLNPNGDA